MEAVIEKALYQAGRISAPNYGDLKKVRWTRSSRTDKGVHSVCTVLSMRMLVDADTFDHSDYSEEVANDINRFLPDEVRVFCVQRVTKSFTARHGCRHRTYHYFLPLKPLLEALKSSKQNVDGRGSEETDAFDTGDFSAEYVVAQLRAFLQLYNGSHPFHNYTDRKRYTEKKVLPEHMKNYFRPRHLIDMAKDGDGEPKGGDDEGVNRGELESEDSPASSTSPEPAGDRAAGAQDASATLSAAPTAVSEATTKTFSKYNPFPRECWWNDDIDDTDRIVQEHYRKIYNCSCSDVIHLQDPDGSPGSGDLPVIRIEITGGSFMLYQIRYMIGTAVGVVLGDFPSTIIPASMSAPARFNHLPLAPPSTLVLVDADFHPLRTPRGQEARHLVIDECGVEMRKKFTREVLLPSLYPIMNSDEWPVWISKMVRIGEGGSRIFISNTYE